MISMLPSLQTIWFLWNTCFPAGSLEFLVCAKQRPKPPALNIKPWTRASLGDSTSLMVLLFIAGRIQCVCGTFTGFLQAPFPLFCCAFILCIKEISAESKTTCWFLDPSSETTESKGSFGNPQHGEIFLEHLTNYSGLVTYLYPR